MARKCELRVKIVQFSRSYGTKWALGAGLAIARLGWGIQDSEENPLCQSAVKKWAAFVTVSRAVAQRR